MVQSHSLVDRLVFGSYNRAAGQVHGPDSATRDIGATRELLARLDQRLDRWPRVTVAGSKGKGSTAVLLAGMLAAGGERVGLVTSPHLCSFNERIRVDGRCVSVEALEEAAREIAPEVEAIAAQMAPPRYLGPGGVILCLAASIFGRAGITVLVVEAGRGGEYDEARLVEANVSVLTPIMMEHADKLGPTLRDIAATKARITAPGSSIVTAPQVPAVQATIRQVADGLQSPVYAAGSDIVIEQQWQDVSGAACTLRLGRTRYPDLRIGLLGLHQVENAATAILAAHALAPFGVRCTAEGIYSGAARVRWPGRLQMLQQQPWVFVDGAINAASARHACDVARRYPARTVTAVVAVPRPKDLDGVCREAAQMAHSIITTEVPAAELTWYDDAAQIAARYCGDVRHMTSADDAFEQALAQAEPDGGVLLLGTQSFIGHALRYWHVDTCVLW